MTKNNSKAFKNNHKHDGASWPYHYNARKHEMIPCKTNPCRYHSNGDDFNITSYDEANNILNEALREAGINSIGNTNDVSSDDANIILKSYLSKTKTKNTSILSSKNNTNSIDSSINSNNSNRIIIPNKTVKKVSLKRTHANHVNITNMITSNEPTGKLSRQTGEYYIYCSPCVMMILMRLLLVKYKNSVIM